MPRSPCVRQLDPPPTYRERRRPGAASSRWWTMTLAAARPLGFTAPHLSKRQLDGRDGCGRIVEDGLAAGDHAERNRRVLPDRERRVVRQRRDGELDEADADAFRLAEVTGTLRLSIASIMLPGLMICEPVPALVTTAGVVWPSPSRDQTFTYSMTVALSGPLEAG